MPVTTQQMLALEAAAQAQGHTPASLMEQAGVGIAREIMRHHPRPGLAVLYLGKGHNAGDALVAARELHLAGWTLAARLAFEQSEWKPLTTLHFEKLPIQVWNDVPEVMTGPVILLDGLLGIGARGPLAGRVRELAAEMNALRQRWHASTIAMDVASGLNADTGVPSEDAVIADLTTVVGQVKQGQLADAAINHVGRISVVIVAALGPVVDDEVITALMLRQHLPRRCFNMHKGQAGRVGIVAGSRGTYGAAVLASLGALRGGSGLITLYAKPDAYDVLAAMCTPEIMVRCVRDYREARQGHDALVIGPGLGFEHEAEVMDLLTEATMPAVVDADAITMLAKHGLPSFAGPRLLTPHPGEMARLQPGALDFVRPALACGFADQHGVTVLYKGARTVVASPHERVSYNTTGTPGMATGGMGDVLSGLCGALLGQGIPMHEAACMGSWLLGRAAECAMVAEAALTPIDVVDALGAAFRDLREGVA